MLAATMKRLFGYSDLRDRVVVATGAAVGGLILLAFSRAVVGGHTLPTMPHDVWLRIHLITVLPSVPLGGYVLLRRKGDLLHRWLGRLWAGLMLIAALSSFGLHRLTGRLSWIHILSVVVLVTVSKGVLLALRHNIEAHRQTMTYTYLGLVLAGLFTLSPGRLLGFWLFG